MYREPGSLRGSRVRNVQEVESKLSPPMIETRNRRGDWTVRFWIVGAVNVAQFNCDITPQSASVQQLQSLENSVERAYF